MHKRLEKPVVALDIDGNMGDYHGHFLRFAAAWLGMDDLEICPHCGGPHPYWDPNSNTDGLPLHELMGVTKEVYRECKLAYRQGGMKRSMPAYEHLEHVTGQLRRRGIELWICTTRPYLRLDNIDPDTREWLRRNKVQYDYMVYGDDKYEQLVQCVSPHNILLISDDEPEQFDKAVNLGLPIVLRDQPYNRYRTDLNDARVFDMLDVFALATTQHNIWKLAEHV